MSSLTLPASAKPSTEVPLHFALLLFPGFQALDVFGPLDALNTLSFLYPTLQLSILSTTLSPVSTLLHHQDNPPPSLSDGKFQQQILPTHTFINPPQRSIDIIIIPGGIGARNNEITSPFLSPLITFLTSNIKTNKSLQGIFTICTGSALLARTNLLNNTSTRLTTNKIAFNRIKNESPGLCWVKQARWVRDDIKRKEGEGDDEEGMIIKLWTCSGISAGLDGIFAFISEEYGEAVADSISRFLEYERKTDPNDDPFALSD